MAESKRPGVLMVSIDIEADLDGQHSVRQTQLDVTADFLIRLTGAYQIPATWSLADPARSALTDAIRQSGAYYEIAILGDRAWVGRGAGRTRFARELHRRVQDARELGLSVSTLALHNVELDEHFDLLVKHRISVVRHGNAVAEHGFRPRSLRFGVWEAPISCRIPSQRHWFSGPTAAARSAVRAATNRAEAIHLAVDVPELAQRGNSALKQMAGLFRIVTQLRDADRLRVITLGEMAALHHAREAAASRPRAA